MSTSAGEVFLHPSRLVLLSSLNASRACLTVECWHSGITRHGNGSGTAPPRSSPVDRTLGSFELSGVGDRSHALGYLRESIADEIVEGLNIVKRGQSPFVVRVADGHLRGRSDNLALGNLGAKVLAISRE